MTLGVLQWIGLSSLGLFLLGWVGYPILMSVLAAPRKPSVGHQRASNEPLPVSIVIATREEPEVVARRVADILATDYPKDRLEIMVSVDVGSRFAVSEYEQRLGATARVVQGDVPGGKAATLNAAVRAAAAETLVFTDSAQTFDIKAITALERYLATSDYAIATGLLGNAGGNARSILGLFWMYELILRRAEARVHSVVAVTGAIYALKKKSWQPLPAGLICDDLYVPMVAIQNGHRVGFCEDARAFDRRVFTLKEEFNRKVRTLTGMLQFCLIRPSILFPWRNPVWLQFFCHKLLRIATPYLLILIAVSQVPLMAGLPLRIYLIATAAVAILLFAALLLKPALIRKGFSAALWISALLAAPMVACARAATGRWDVWKNPASGIAKD